MKKLPYLLSLLLLMTMTVFTSCKDDEGDDPIEDDPIDTATEQLEGTWNVTSVTRAGTAVDLGGETVTLNFTSEGGYNATNVDAMPGESPAFPSGNAWTFRSTAPPFNQIIITPGPVNFDAVSLSDNNLSFTYTTEDAKSAEEFTVAVTATKQ